MWRDGWWTGLVYGGVGGVLIGAWAAFSTMRHDGR